MYAHYMQEQISMIALHPSNELDKWMGGDLDGPLEHLLQVLLQRSKLSILTKNGQNEILWDVG